MLPRTAAIPCSVAGSLLVSYHGAQGKLTNGIRVDAILGHVSAHGLAICLKSHNAYTSYHHHHHHHHRRRRCGRWCFLRPRIPTLFVSALLIIPSLTPSLVESLSLEDVALLFFAFPLGFAALTLRRVTTMKIIYKECLPE